MLAELQSLAALASSLPDITVETGEPGCLWSFNWTTRLITADPADLTLRHPDYCRGLILHEAAHGAITRIGGIVPPELMQNEAGLHHLLNVVEDCRIENWLQQRFPGCRPWIRLYNDRLLIAPSDPAARARLAGDPAGGFILGLLSEWWREQAPCELHPLSTAAIAEVKPHFMRAVAAFPEPQPPAAAKVLPLYASHPVAACFRAADRDTDPAAAECVIRMSQHRMWTITWTQIMPVFRKLLEHPDSEPTRRMLASRATSGWRAARHNGRLTSPAAQDPGNPDPSPRSDHAYHQAVARHGGLIESCADVVLRQLIEESRPKTTRFHRSGSRLDLRMAMQFDADPRQYEHLYLRRTLPSHPDPAFIILADESSSMRGERARTTFEAVVVLRDVCLRLGIPLAIVGFGSTTRNIQGWEDENGINVRRKLSALLVPSGARSELRPALVNAQMLLSSLAGSSRPRIWILSDGEVSDPDAVRKIINQIRISGIPVHGLGLGPDSHGLTQVLPDAAIGISAGELAQFFARLLQAQTRV